MFGDKASGSQREDRHDSSGQKTTATLETIVVTPLLLPSLHKRVSPIYARHNMEFSVTRHSYRFACTRGSGRGTDMERPGQVVTDHPLIIFDPPNRKGTAAVAAYRDG